MLHWPCVTDLSGLSTYGLNNLMKEDKCSPPTLLKDYVTPTFVNGIVEFKV